MAQEDTALSAPRTAAGVLTPALGAGARSPGVRRLADRLGRRLTLDRLRWIESGQLEVVENGSRHVFGRPSGDPPLTASITISDPRAWGSFSWGGSIGAAEAYSEGRWSAADLTAVVRVLARNQDALRRLDGGAFLRRPLRRFLHRRRPNTRAGSRRNVAAHYDRGDHFFATFLDPTLTYSCAVFDRGDTPLEDAQRAKLDLICRKLSLGPEDRLVEIGSGWGSFAIHAAGRYGCRVVTTTISERQFRRASRAVAEAGLAGRVTVLREDYRTLAARFPGSFNKLASIEMVEAVGHDYLPAYFRAVDRLLAPDGVALLQAILIPDQRYEDYRRSVDFIQAHIFPGGLLPSLARLQTCAAGASGLRLLDLEDLTPHYARTLGGWRRRFDDAEAALAALGVTETERRTWRFYFSFCEGGFLERTIGCAQLLYAKPGFRGRVPAARGRAPAGAPDRASR